MSKSCAGSATVVVLIIISFLTLYLYHQVRIVTLLSSSWTQRYQVAQQREFMNSMINWGAALVVEQYQAVIQALGQGSCTYQVEVRPFSGLVTLERKDAAIGIAASITAPYPSGTTIHALIVPRFGADDPAKPLGIMLEQYQVHQV